MRNVRIDIQYDGTNYAGWQIQKNSITIQEKIEDAINKITNEKVKLTGSGRTDSGVHAIHQVGNFKTECSIPDDKIHIALNTKLPPDIRIIKSTTVDEDFNARYSAKSRTYKYIINQATTLSPFKRLYCWHRKRSIDIKNLKSIMTNLIGVHDFTNLCASSDSSKTKIREIKSVKIYKKNEDEIEIFITANAFLHKMVRMIVGTGIMILEKGLPSDFFNTIIHSESKSNNVFTAEPQGLFLYEIKY